MVSEAYGKVFRKIGVADWNSIFRALAENELNDNAVVKE